MKPIKFKIKLYKDNRGYLKEIIPLKLKKKFIYSILTNSKKNVIRGMHYDKRLEEEKLVHVLNGKIVDVTVNLIKGKDFGQIHYNIIKKDELLFIPRGFAHGYLCLGKNNTILYLLTKKFSKKNNAGFLWNDKRFNINWKIKNPILSVKDKNLNRYIR